MISDLAKVHAVKPKMPGFAYYGFYGCCSPYNNDWYTQFNASHNSELWLRDDTGAAVSAATGYRGTYVYDLCNPKMLLFYKEVILKRFMESSSVHGVFFVRDDPFGGLLIRRLANQQSVAIQDEVDSFVEGGYGNTPFSGQGGRKLAMLSRSVALSASLT